MLGERGKRGDSSFALGGGVGLDEDRNWVSVEDGVVLNGCVHCCGLMSCALESEHFGEQSIEAFSNKNEPNSQGPICVMCTAFFLQQTDVDGASPPPPHSSSHHHLLLYIATRLTSPNPAPSTLAPPRLHTTPRVSQTGNP